MRHFDVRLKLDDVVESTMIMPLLIDTIKRLPMRKVLFWYNGGISDDTVSLFLEKWNKETNVSLELCNDTEFNHVWFDIISEADNKLLTSSYRFKYVYSNIDDIMKGIYNFYHTVKFVGSEKKKSRRNKS